MCKFHAVFLAIFGSSIFLACSFSLRGQTQLPGRAPEFDNSDNSSSTLQATTQKERTVPVASPRMRFRDVAAEAGLTTIPHSRSDRRYVLETMGGGGIALFDCDNDGKLDIVVVNDSAIEPFLKGGDLMVTLYHQDANSQTLHFTDVTKSSGLTARGWGMGIAVGDFDNDGFPDLYVTGYGHNVLYRNLGGCKFEDVTEKAGVGAGGFSTGAAWADYDRDGFLDLFVARYVRTDVHNLPDPKWAFGYKGVLVEVPDAMEGETDFLFRNRGDGRFENVSEKAGTSDPHKLHGMGVVWGDYDGDGWPDLFVTNDSGWNFLYHNRQDGTFEEVGISSGTGLGPFGQNYGNMAADFSDFDRDGKLDLFVARFGSQPASLYWNRSSQFVDIADRAGIAKPTFQPVKWGTGFGDFDDDGWPDIFLVNGNFSSLMDSLPNEVRYAEPIQLFRNLGTRTFEEIANASGLNDLPPQSRRGTAFGDINNDGKLDVVVFNANGPPSLFLNETSNKNHRVLIRLIGTKSNRAAIGARVTVITKSLSQIDEVRGGGSYDSTSDTRLHFGLGDDAVMSEVQVRWPSGLTQRFADVTADAIYEITEGETIKKVALLGMS
jgi:enediyne biosynthesis protein E4